MADYRIVFIERSEKQADEGWAVQRKHLGAGWEFSGVLFPTKQQAQAEADKLAAADPSNA